MHILSSLNYHPQGGQKWLEFWGCRVTSDGGHQKSLVIKIVCYTDPLKGHAGIVLCLLFNPPQKNTKVNLAPHACPSANVNQKQLLWLTKHLGGGG